MCNLPNVTPTLVICLADPQIWAEFHLMKIGRYFDYGHTPAIKGDVYGGQKWLTALKIHIQEELKKKGGRG